MTTKKYPQNLHTPKNIHFLKTEENIENQNCEPKKNDPSLRMNENIRESPWGDEVIYGQYKARGRGHNGFSNISYDHSPTACVVLHENNVTRSQ